MVEAKKTDALPKLPVLDSAPPVLPKDLFDKPTALEKKENTYKFQFVETKPAPAMNLDGSAAMIPDSLPLLPPMEDPLSNEIPEFITQAPMPELEIFDADKDSGPGFSRYAGLKKPLFIRTDMYSEVLTAVDVIRDYVEESGELIYGLENIKKNTDIEHQEYKKTMEEIQRKIIYVDKVLFEKEG
ncbi:MAG: hypothetical protein HGA85_08640 [Nanoarchaeota archaeon]|nr:hypothetical protein [Nanoarchaeota archaeon]